ncbi:MAG: hypothetical protein Alpg2KO_20600 [Alphaproteobacteria bacterium]
MPEQSFTPTRAAGLNRLADFLPRAGRAYASQRNYDRGPQDRSNVSMLSPWMRHRLIAEEELFAEAALLHGLPAGEKFLQEVIWRTYWKGWMELRPQVWDDYKSLLHSTPPTGPDALARAESGQTGIECFDAWAQELIETGWLHNHARMWFASIWIFTLKLDWWRGADFFYRHLVDGDAAVNTLSWRWVAGLQTIGKHYLARADNIARCTNGRFSPAPGDLNEQAEALSGQPHSPRQKLADMPLPDPSLRSGLLLTDEDLDPTQNMLQMAGPILIITTSGLRSPNGAGEQTARFSQGAAQDAASRLQNPVTLLHDPDPSALSDWVAANQLDQIIGPEIPVSPARDWVKTALQHSESSPALRLTRKDWDSLLWPHATHGFFRFKSQLPVLMDRLESRESPFQRTGLTAQENLFSNHA